MGRLENALFLHLIAPSAHAPHSLPAPAFALLLTPSLSVALCAKEKK